MASIPQRVEELEKEGIIVSPTEPVGNNRKKVWLQKGKNKFNVNLIPSNAVISNNLKGTLTFSNNTSDVGYTDTGIKLSDVFQGIVGQTYTLNFNTTSNAPRKDSFYLLGANIFIKKETPFVLTQEMLDSTIILYGGYNETSTISNILIEQNATATSYEEYIKEKVFLLNKNGVYEEFRKKQEINITTGVEFETGRIIDGKKEYGKRIDYGYLPNNQNKAIQVLDYQYSSTGTRGTARNGNRTTFFPNRDIGAYVENGWLNVTTYADMSSYTAIVTVYYTKN